jgi:hypothetical protein
MSAAARPRKAVPLRRWSEAGNAALCAALCFLFGALVLQPWRGSLGVPYLYRGDSTLYQASVKGVLDHGWYWHNSSLGAPRDAQLFDFPTLGGDPLNVLVFKLLGLFTSDSAVVMNVFFLLTFPAVGLAAYLVLRRLTLSVPVAMACSILYALLPYHFTRGEGHLLLSAYYAVPLGAYLVLSVLGDRELFAGRRGALGTVALCAVIAFASASYYYSAFTVVLVASAAGLRAIALRSRRPLLQGGGVAAVIVGLSLLTLLPSFAFWAANGTNSAVAHRSVFESELYALKFAQLVLPIEHHRIGPLARARDTYDGWFPSTEAATDTPLGIVGAIGFVGLLGLCLVQLVSPGRRLAPALYGNAAIASLLALLFAWVGGFAVFIALLDPQVRSWNRLSIFIAFFALLAVGLVLDRLLGRLGSIAGAVLLCGVLTIGVLDQTSRAYEPRYDALAAEYRSDGDFVRTIESQVPRGSMIFQLPYVEFPEAPPPQRMADYDLLHGYLHSDDLRWSYGRIKGRSGDRAAAIGSEKVPDLVRDAKAAGFAGIYVDRFGYPDSGKQVEAELTQATGDQQPLISPNARLSFFRLAG